MSGGLGRKRRMRWLRRIAWVVGGVAAVWTVGWFAAAPIAMSMVESRLARAEDKGLFVRLGERSVSGFPFALKMRLFNTTLEAPSRGLAARIDEVRIHWRLSAPTAATLHLPAPIHLVQARADTRRDALIDAKRLRIDVARTGSGRFAATAIASEISATLMSADGSAASVRGAGLRANASFDRAKGRLNAAGSVERIDSAATDADSGARQIVVEGVNGSATLASDQILVDAVIRKLSALGAAADAERALASDAAIAAQALAAPEPSSPDVAELAKRAVSLEGFPQLAAALAAPETAAPADDDAPAPTGGATATLLDRLAKLRGATIKAVIEETDLAAALPRAALPLQTAVMKTGAGVAELELTRRTLTVKFDAAAMDFETQSSKDRGLKGDAEAFSASLALPVSTETAPQGALVAVDLSQLRLSDDTLARLYPDGAPPSEQPPTLRLRVSADMTLSDNLFAQLRRRRLGEDLASPFQQAQIDELEANLLELSASGDGRLSLAPRAGAADIRIEDWRPFYKTFRRTGVFDPALVGVLKMVTGAYVAPTEDERVSSLKLRLEGSDIFINGKKLSR